MGNAAVYKKKKKNRMKMFVLHNNFKFNNAITFYMREREKGRKGIYLQNGYVAWTVASNAQERESFIVPFCYVIDSWM